MIAPETAKIVNVEDEPTIPEDEPTIPQLQQLACDVTDTRPTAMQMTLGRRHVVNFTYNGVPFERLLALVPKSWLNATPRQTGVFLDARDLAEPIAFHIFRSDSVTTEEVVEALEVPIPPGIRLHIAGTSVWAEHEEVPAETSVEDTTSEESAPRPTWKRPFYVTAAVYTRQTYMHTHFISLIPEDDDASLIAELDDTVFENDHWRSLCAVQPQPDSAYVSVVTESWWTVKLGLLPVLVDLTGIAGRRFASFVDSEFALEDIISMVGSDWDDGYNVYAAGDDEPPEAGQIYSASRGMLISVVPE